MDAVLYQQIRAEEYGNKKPFDVYQCHCGGFHITTTGPSDQLINFILSAIQGIGNVRRAILLQKISNKERVYQIDHNKFGSLIVHYRTGEKILDIQPANKERFDDL